MLLEGVAEAGADLAGVAKLAVLRGVRAAKRGSRDALSLSDQPRMTNSWR
jgi:hypothetical protein